MKKIALFIIAALLLVATLASCGTDRGEGKDETDIYDLIDSISRALEDGSYNTSPGIITPELEFRAYDSYAEVIGCKNAIGEVEIPGEYEGKPVTKIAAEAFADSRSITMIRLPEGLLEIGDKAFFGCVSIAEIIIPDTVKKIGDYAFFGCFALGSVELGAGVETIGTEALGYCLSLSQIKVDVSNAAYSDIDGVLMSADKTVLVSYPAGKPGGEYTIPDGVLTVNNFAFAYAQNLVHITVGDTVNSLGDNTFRQCAALESATLGSGLTHIGANTFVSCTSLTKLTISEGAVTIGYLDGEAERGGSFSGCVALAEINLPSTITAIYAQSFSDCKALKTINFAGSSSDWNAITRGAGNDALSSASVNYGK